MTVIFLGFLYNINLMFSQVFLTSFRCFLLLDLCTRLPLLKKLQVFRLYISYIILLHSCSSVPLCYPHFFWFSLQALIQFSDAETASSARNALDGRSIPRYALYHILPIMGLLRFGCCSTVTNTV